MNLTQIAQLTNSCFPSEDVVLSKCTFRQNQSKYDLKIVSMNNAVTYYMINAVPYCGTITEKEETEAVPTYYVRKFE